MARRKRVLWWKFRDQRRRVWKVYLVRSLKHPLHKAGAGGVTDHDTRTILIRYSPSYSDMCEWLMHEQCHAFSGPRSWETGEYNSQDEMNFHAEENTIERIQRGLALVIRQYGGSFPPIPDEASQLAA